MHQFFVAPEAIDLETGVVCLTGPDVHHIDHVLRLKIGDQVTISDGQGKSYYCIMKSIQADKVYGTIKDPINTNHELKTKVTLFQGIPKGDKMETIIQKCVELGVHTIVPVSMKRCVAVIPPAKADKKIKRFQDIALGAAKQSKRDYLPQVTQVMDFKSAADYAKTLDIVLLAYEDAEGFEKTKRLMTTLGDYDHVGLWIGPEGGWDPKELTYCAGQETVFETITLGKRILRTETAGMAAMAMMMLYLEEE